MVLTEAPISIITSEINSSEIILPFKYRATLNLIAETSQRLNVPYAVLGSIGVATVSNTSLVIKDFSGSWRKGKPDIDIFVIGTDQQRDEFFHTVKSQLSENSPLVDFSAGHHNNVGFNTDDEPFLRYKDLRIPLLRKLFEPKITVNEPQIPVLFPQTYFAMIMLCNNTIYPPRIAERIKLLQNAFQQFPDFDDKLLPPFNTFKKEIYKDYPLHYLMIDIRRRINSSQQLQPYISALKKLVPGVIQGLRKLY